MAVVVVLLVRAPEAALAHAVAEHGGEQPHFACGQRWATAREHAAVPVFFRRNSLVVLNGCLFVYAVTVFAFFAAAAAFAAALLCFSVMALAKSAVTVLQLSGRSRR